MSFKVQGKDIRPLWCPPCAEERERIERNEGPRLVTKTDSDTLHAMEELGVNVRRHGRCTLDNWTPDESSTPREAAKAFVRDLLAAGRYSEVRGLLLLGDTGTGKTHIAAAIVRAALEGGVPVGKIVYDRADRLITMVQDTYGTGSTGKILGKRERATLWVVDDLGAEKATPDVLRILTDLLTAREGHPNVVTSNYDQQRLAERFDREDGWVRLSSRLGAQNFRAVQVTGRDHRFTRPAA